MRRAVVLIIGGGPAGSAAAITLARAGVRPELVERSAGDRDVVCGGFLGWDALAGLRRLGLDPAALGARPIHRLRLIAGDREVETELPYAAAGLSRRRLDAALLAEAAASGAIVARGRAARAIDEAGNVRLDGGEEIAADALFLATGKHELRGVGRDLGKQKEPPAAGLRAAVPLRPALERALAGTIELHLFDQGYAGLLVQEDGTANFCFSISRARLSEAGDPAALVASLIVEAPRLGDRLGGIPGSWEAVAGIPYGWRAAASCHGLFRVGDQAAVIASLAGDGIAIALATGRAAAEAWRAAGPAGANAYQQDFARRSARPVAIAEALRHMAERRWSRAAMMRLLKLVPGAAGLGARLTRID